MWRLLQSEVHEGRPDVSLPLFHTTSEATFLPIFSPLYYLKTENNLRLGRESLSHRSARKTFKSSTESVLLTRTHLQQAHALPRPPGPMSS